jgi:membrane protein
MRRDGQSSAQVETRGSAREVEARPRASDRRLASHGAPPESSAQTGLVARVVGYYRRLGDFFGRQIWEQRLEELSTARAWGYKTSRILYCTVRGAFLGDTLQVQAAALTYFTVLSLVPLLAFAFALLKGFGAYDALIEESIRPYVLGLLSGNQSLRTAFEQILSFVDNTGVTSLGFIGLLTLLYAATRLLRNIEGALNGIWSVRTGRETLQQVRDYLAIIVVTPICLMAAAGLTATAEALDIFGRAGDRLGIGAFVDWAIGVSGPLVVIFLGLLFLYKVMPYTSVRMLSAVTGAAIGALLWYLVLIAHVKFQVGVAQYNALYSSFGAIPIFLAWLQLSWLVVLIGAQIASTHQNSRGLAQRRRFTATDQALKEAIGLASALRIGDAFLSCEGPISERKLSTELAVPEPMLRELLETLVQASIVVQAEPISDPTYVLARPAERIRVKDVLDALRKTHGVPNDSFTAHAQMGSMAAQLWRELDAALSESPANRTLREVLDARDAEPHAQEDGDEREAAAAGEAITPEQTGGDGAAAALRSSV